MNVRESEAVAALLEARGHVRAVGEDDAELVIVNSCTVRDMAERKAIGKTGNLLALRDGRGRNAQDAHVRMVGIMGCAVGRIGERIGVVLPGIDFAVGPRRFGAIPDIVDDILAGRRANVVELSDADEVPAGLDAHLDPVPPSGFQAYVTILLGCDNRCSYCIVPDVRGHEFSRPAREVVAEVRALAARGVKEVCLLGQSVLRYGRRSLAWSAEDAPSPGGYAEPFPRLLEAICSIPGIRRVRFTSAHPHGCTEELVRAYREFPAICRHLHLPVQSGSDSVLAEMGRHYTRAEYLASVRRLRELDPDFALTTDVIVGYPGETEADFELTRSLMEETAFDNAFVFKYSPRPGTRSAMLPDDVPTAEKERRDQVLLADQQTRGLARNRRLVGSVREVLVEGPSIRNTERWSGRDGGNRIVVFDPRPGLARGDLVQVRVTDAHAQILLGEIA